MRRRRSLWLAGGCSRGAGATPGRRADGNVARRASPAGGTSPPGKDVWVPSVPGVGGAPRHQPPANKRERLRRTKCAPRNDHRGRCSATASPHQPASGALYALRAMTTAGGGWLPSYHTNPPPAHKMRSAQLRSRSHQCGRTPRNGYRGGWWVMLVLMDGNQNRGYRSRF